MADDILASEANVFDTICNRVSDKGTKLRRVSIRKYFAVDQVPSGGFKDPKSTESDWGTHKFKSL
jgi:hypothetical protein